MYRRRLNHTPTVLGELHQPPRELSHRAGSIILDILIEAGLSNPDVIDFDCEQGLEECKRFIANIRALSTKQSSETR